MMAWDLFKLNRDDKMNRVPITFLENLNAMATGLFFADRLWHGA